jgi:excisionase family DNA binding protein
MISNLHFSFPVDQLATAIVEKLKPQLASKVKVQLTDDQFLTRKETSKKLNISLPTLNAYTKKGILQGYKVGVRVLYKKSEIDASVIAINYVRK